MTHEAKPRDPIIKQHFDAIEDKIVVDAIAQRMAQIHDVNGPRFSADTHIGTHDSMAAIAEVCAAEYGPHLTHEEIWKRGLQEAVMRAIEADFALQPDDESSLSMRERRELLERRSTSIHAAIAMYAIDRSTRKPHPEDWHTIDDLLMSRRPKLRSAINNAIRETRICGTVYFDEQGEVHPLDEIIDERWGEIEQRNYRDTLATLEVQSPETTKTARQAQSNYLYNKTHYLDLRNAKTITGEQYDTLAETIERMTLAGHPANAVALRALPTWHLRDAYREASRTADVIETLLVAYADYSDGPNPTPANLLCVLDDYFPGGITGTAAREHPAMQRLTEKYGSTVELLANAMPTIEYPRGCGSPYEIEQHNERSKDLLHRGFRHILGDDDFAQRLCDDVLRSRTPRAHMPGDKNSHDPDSDRELLRWLERLHTEFGTETLQQLHETFDLSALDCLTNHDLRVLNGLRNGDPGIIQRLQQQDVTLMVYDARGSENNAVRTMLTQTRTHEPTHGRIAVSWHTPSAFYRAIALLEQHNVQFCSLMFAAHGNPGSVVFNKGTERIELSSDPVSTWSSDDPSWIRAPRSLHISQSQLGRIVRDRMCLPKHAANSTTPTKKRVIMLNCYSDVEPQPHAVSIAHAAARAVGDAQLWATDTSNMIVSRRTPRRIYDGTIDAEVIGTENTTLVSTDLTPGLVAYGPARGEPDTDEYLKSRQFGPNTVLLTPAEYHHWLGGDATTKTTQVTRTPFTERIIA